MKQRELEFITDRLDIIIELLEETIEAVEKIALKVEDENVE